MNKTTLLLIGAAVLLLAFRNKRGKGGLELGELEGEFVPDTKPMQPGQVLPVVQSLPVTTGPVYLQPDPVFVEPTPAPVVLYAVDMQPPVKPKKNMAIDGLGRANLGRFTTC